MTHSARDHPQRDTARPPLVVAAATAADRERIYRLRHAVYADELGQHPSNVDGVLRDELDDGNEYVVVRIAGEVAGFVSITPAGAPRFSVDKYLPRSAWPFPFDATVHEVRLLTVAEPLRGSYLSILLMYAALRLIESRGGRRIVAIGRREMIELYRKAGLHPLGMQFASGAVGYEAMTVTVAALQAQVAERSDLLARMEARTDWQLEVPFRPSRPVATCYHGGAFFDAIGPGFDDLERRHDIVNADVLDAWFDPSPRVIEALSTDLPWILRTSPPTHCEGMVAAIAEARGVQTVNILPGAGSSNLIYLALPHWLTPQSRVLILDPMYGEYAHALEKVIDCQVDRFPLACAESYDVDPTQLAETIARGAYDFVILVNPNSPTGRHLELSYLLAVLSGGPRGTRFWVDETYIDYVGAEQSAERYAAASANAVVCKSMSKVYALSGARCAYLCGPESLIADLKPLAPPWSVSLPGQVAAVAALSDSDYYQDRYAETHRYRLALENALVDELHLAVTPGVANFVLCHLPAPAPTAATVVARCREQGVFLRDVSNMGRAFGDRTIRVAVKDEATNRRIVGALRAAIDETREQRSTQEPDAG
ncbi:MAG TPA: aminotransferase class I/II-fold pyridoxal phosphate-dependent enzyme [Thermoanaerobaculia bacterium]|nr:aminotransferase class I/II-fold pyridoxal phosphate-dependent enzyme [Thermoanaerobaculia bacterium]